MIRLKINTTSLITAIISFILGFFLTINQKPTLMKSEFNLTLEQMENIKKLVEQDRLEDAQHAVFINLSSRNDVFQINKFFETKEEKNMRETLELFIAGKNEK
jgi:phage-related baseplate assembly protein